MKALAKLAFAIVLISIALASCKKESKKNTTQVGALGANYPNVLNTIVTPAILDTLKKHGLTVHDGLTPGIVNGIYLFSPDECLYDNSGDYYVGETIDDYEYKFANQNNTAYTINVKYDDITAGDNIGSDSLATYISGTGNSFTIFAEIQGVLGGVSYTSLEIYSGVYSSSGILAFQNALFLKSKVGDIDNSVVAPVGTIRIFADQDGLSEKQGTFGVNKSRTPGIGASRLKLALSAFKHK